MGIRIDFGRIFPGIIVFFIGVGLFLLFLLLAVFSFFLFFVPSLHWIFYVDLDVLLASVLLMIIGGILALSGFAGWGWKPREEELGRAGFIVRRADRDSIGIPERIGELLGLFVSALVILFFVANQLRGTGFFTPSFGPLEEALFYGAWVFAAAVSLVRVLFGRRNAVRPLEVTEAFIWAVSAIWLLAVFPFNFARLPDLLPRAVRFLFFWVDNEIGALVMVLIGIGSLANMAYTAALYFMVGSELKKRRSAAQMP